MPAEFKDGSIVTYDDGTQTGMYKEDGTDTDRSFETVRPVVQVQPGKSVRVMVKTPSGREVSIAIKIDGIDV